MKAGLMSQLEGPLLLVAAVFFFSACVGFHYAYLWLRVNYWRWPQYQKDKAWRETVKPGDQAWFYDYESEPVIATIVALFYNESGARVAVLEKPTRKGVVQYTVDLKKMHFLTDEKRQEIACQQFAYRMQRLRRGNERE